jgi:tripartite-type tricarboxylate transporter receptor subunit TctC
MIAAGPNVLAVAPSLAVNSLKDLLAMARAKPGQLNYASAGVGSFQHLGSALFVSLAKVNIVHVPFKGGGPAMVDVIAGNTQVMLGSLVQTLPQIKSGKLKALGVGGTKRSPTMPEVPTIAEAGVPGFVSGSWAGVLAPGGTPKPIVDRLSSEIAKIVRLPDVRTRLAELGVEPSGNSPAEFRAFMEAEVARWATVIEQAKIRLD